MNAENVKSQMRKGTLEYCILLLLKRNPLTPLISFRSYRSEVDRCGRHFISSFNPTKNSELLSYQWIESTQGPPRKYYQLTEKGELFLGELEASWQELNDTINHIRNN